MIKKIAAFVAALAISATAIGTLAVTAASDWREDLFTSSTFTATGYDGLIFLECANGTATMSIYHPDYKINNKSVQVQPYYYDWSKGSYVEMSTDNRVVGTSQSITASASSISGADYLCNTAILYNTTDPGAGTYKTFIVHIKKTSSDPDPDPIFSFDYIH